MSQHDEVVQETAYNQEVGYVFSRNMQVTVCAVGSTIFSYRIGQYISEMIAPGSYWVNMLTPALFVGVAFLAIDWAFLNSLVGASSVADEGYRKKLMGKAKLFFACTLMMSLVSNFFISEEAKGESHLKQFNEEQQTKDETKAALTDKALTLIAQSKAEQPALVAAAKKEGRTLLAAAVASGSESHRKDYLAAKANEKHWFWTCKRGEHCTQRYIDYRNRIIAAEAEAATLLAAAQGHGAIAQAGILATVQDTSGQAMQSFVASNVLTLEAERQFKGVLISLGLGALALICGLLAMSTTSTLAEHRKQFGQQVPEDNVTSIMTILDFIKRIPDFVLDILHNVTTRPFDALKESGWVQSYSFAGHSDARSRGARTYARTKGAVHADAQDDAHKETVPHVDDEVIIPKAVDTNAHKAKRPCRSGSCIQYIEHTKKDGTVVLYSFGQVNGRVNDYTDRLSNAQKNSDAKKIKSLTQTLNYWKTKLQEFDK